MDKEQIKKIIDNPPEYDVSKEDTYWGMIIDMFSEKMRWVMLTVWIWFIIFMVPIILSVIFFFMTDQTKLLIMYATIFTCCILCIGFLKVLAWVMLSKHNIKREIKRLELHIAELTETVKNK